MPGKHHRQQTAAAAPASPTTKPTAKYTNKDGSKFITVPKANATNDSSFPSPTAASGAKGQSTAEEPSTNGARQPVNRKKQKRREKLAAKLAAEQEASGHMHENGLPSPPASHEHHAADADADDSDDDAHEYLRNHARHLQEHGFSGDSESKKKSKKKKKKAGPEGDHEHANTREPRPAPESTERRGPGISKEKIWNTSSAEERERIKQFWLGLGEDERKSLVKVEKDAVLKKMKEQQRHTCSCTVCGRKRTAIEEELEGLYDAYYQELEHFANQGGQGEPPMMGSNRPLNPMAGAPSHSPSANYTNHRPSRGRIVEQLGDEDEEDDDDEEEDEDDYSEDDDELEVVGDDDYSEELSEQSTRNSYANDFFNFGASLTVQGGILTVADDLLKNDGKKFIEMMEQLAERRMQREEDASKQFERSYNHANGERYAHHPPPEDEGYDEEDEEYEEEEEDDYDSGDGEDNMTEEQRMEEGRRMFQIFAARMFEQRVLTAYREKVAKERQQKLLEELEDESKQESQRAAKRAKEAEKRKAKAQKKREKEAALKEQREREKAEEEAQQEAEKARKAEEQRVKAEEKRKKKEALKKAEEEERRRKETERQRKAQQQLDTERKSREAKEIKEREKKARDELARQQDKELQERKEREARERKEQQEREKREREAKAKAEAAEREAREKKKQEDRAAHKAAVLAAQPAITLAKRSAPQSVPAAVPALPHHPSNASVAPPQLTTPAMPKGPTSSIRARQGSQHGHVAVPAQVPAHTHHHHQMSYPATPTRPSPGLTVATGKSGSSSAQSGQNLRPRNTTSPLNANAKSFSNPAPMFPMQPFTQGMMQPQPPPGFGPRLSNDASFPPMIPTGYRRSPPGIMTTMPPGLNGPAGGLILPLVPGAGPPPGFGFSPSLDAPGANSQLFQEAGAAPSHVRKQSTGFEASSTPASAHPIGRLQPIGRPSSVVQGHQPPSRSPSHATLSTDNTDDRRLGSSALLADSDDALEDFSSNRRGTTAAPGPRTVAASGFSFGPDALFPNSHNPWAATASSGFGPSPPPGFQVPMSASTGWGPSTPSKAVFGAPPGLGRSLDPRSVALRKYLCRACEELGGAVDPSVAADPVSPGSRGPEKFVPIEAVKAKVDQLCQGTHQMVHEKELLDLCETEGNETNGGGSFEMREDKAARSRSILWVPDAGPPRNHNRVVGGLGEIGSPVFGQPGFPQRPSR